MGGTAERTTDTRSCGTSRPRLNQPAVAVVDKELKRAVVIDVVIAADSNIRKTEPDKQARTDVEDTKPKILGAIGALGAVATKLEEWIQQIPRATSEGSVQKSAVLL